MSIPKPCPFCGHLPDLNDPDTLYPNGTGWKVRANGLRSYHNYREVPKEQWCYSFHCVTTSGGCGVEISADSAEEALAKWDQRVGMKKNINIDDSFDYYFNEMESFSFRSERFAQDVSEGNVEIMKKWLHAAFVKGASVVAQDSINTLNDYATAVAGINEPTYTAEQMYDRAASDLSAYYEQVLPGAVK